MLPYIFLQYMPYTWFRPTTFYGMHVGGFFANMTSASYMACELFGLSASTMYPAHLM